MRSHTVEWRLSIIIIDDFISCVVFICSVVTRSGSSLSITSYSQTYQNVFTLDQVLLKWEPDYYGLGMLYYLLYTMEYVFTLQNENVCRESSRESRLVSNMRRPERRTAMKVLVKKTFLNLWTIYGSATFSKDPWCRFIYLHNLCTVRWCWATVRRANTLGWWSDERWCSFILRCGRWTLMNFKVSM